MTKRKYISWKRKCAAAVLDGMLVRERFGLDPKRWYNDAKKMTEDQFLSLFQWDHNILHDTQHEHRDEYWNLTPMLIAEHQKKTKKDAAIIAKGRRIRRQGYSLTLSPEAREELRNGNPKDVLREVFHKGKYEGRQEANRSWVEEANRPGDAVQWVLNDMAEALGRGFEEGARNAYERMQRPRDAYSENYDAIKWDKKPKRKLRSRGFDKTKRRKMSGKVVPR